MLRVALYGFLFAAAGLAQIAPANSSGVSMGHLHIVGPNTDLHRKIWVDVLGGKSVKSGPLECARFPDVFVCFREGQSSGGTVGSVVDHLGFAVKDLAATKAKLTAAGVKIVRENPDTKQFFAEFPDEVRVEFSEFASQEMPIRHHHVHFATNQIDEMRAWYVEKFGAVAGMRGRFKAADVPGVNLSWNPAETAPAATKGRALDHIGFEVKDIDAMCKKLEAAGLKLEMPPTRGRVPGLAIAFFSDPWGTRIELTEGLSKF